MCFAANGFLTYLQCGNRVTAESFPLARANVGRGLNRHEKNLILLSLPWIAAKGGPAGILENSINDG